MPVNGYPDLQEGIDLWKKTIEIRRDTMNLIEDPDYIVHTENVAKFAQKIASKIKGMDADIAYVAGLLHDCGKIKREWQNNKFHGHEGYDLLMAAGYPQAAQICLTHTFPDKDFTPKDIGYPEHWMVPVIELLKKIEYDDYDRLIQYCDKFSDGPYVVTLEERAVAIRDRYNGMKGYSVDEKRYQAIIKEGQKLKSYFDQLCGVDTYELLGVNPKEVHKS